jgi:hypothetical protein
MKAAWGLALLIVMCGTALADTIDGPPSKTPPLRFEDDVSEMQQIVGPPLAFTLGFGIGHAAEGRWHEKGWMFTATDTAGFALFIGGNIAGLSCETETSCGLAAGAFAVGLLGLGVSRIWQTIDTVTGARAKNRRVMQERLRLEPMVAPPRGGGSGGVAGLSLRF